MKKISLFLVALASIILLQTGLTLASAEASGRILAASDVVDEKGMTPWLWRIIAIIGFAAIFTAGWLMARARDRKPRVTSSKFPYFAKATKGKQVARKKITTKKAAKKKVIEKKKATSKYLRQERLGQESQK